MRKEILQIASKQNAFAQSKKFISEITHTHFFLRFEIFIFLKKRRNAAVFGKVSVKEQQLLVDRRRRFIEQGNHIVYHRHPVVRAVLALKSKREVVSSNQVLRETVEDHAQQELSLRPFYAVGKKLKFF
jgi:hypothetical protein